MYRFCNPDSGEHFFTAQEKDDLVRIGWKDEGTGWTLPEKSSRPVYRLYNPNVFANNHIFTVNKKERDCLIGLGRHGEGIAWDGCR